MHSSTLCLILPIGMDKHPNMGPNMSDEPSNTDLTADQASADQALEQPRKRIDELDQEIQTLVTERALCALTVAKIKKQHQLSGHDSASRSTDASSLTNDSSSTDDSTQYFRPEREAQVLKKVMERNKGPIDDESMARLFRQIMSCCLALEQQLKIAFLGPEGTFTQEAAVKHFGDSVKTIPLGTIGEVFREVAAGAANFGVVPVENSSEGIVNTTLDAFSNYDLRICGEVELRIHQNLLISETTKPNHITRIYSHPQSLGQCRQWLDAHWPQVERHAVSSNADAAKRIQSEWHAAAIAGDMAAEIYGLTKLAEKIEDNPNNTTRFLIIGRQELKPSGDDKTSIIVSTPNAPGALFRLLAPFSDADISLTRIETRPSRDDMWGYVFFIDFLGHESDAAVQSVFEKIRADVVDLRCLGSYPRAVL